MSTCRTTVRIKSKIESSLKPVEVGDQMQAQMTTAVTSTSRRTINDMSDNTVPQDKGYGNGNPKKKANRISGKTVVIIDESLVKQLAIEEENTWFEESQVNDGILLKISRYII